VDVRVVSMVLWAFLLIIPVLPVRFRLGLSNSSRFCLKIHASYAWGMVCYNYDREIENSCTTARFFGARVYNRVRGTADRGKKEKERAGREKSPFRSKQYVRFMLRVGKGVYGTAVAKSYQAKLRVGFEDPAYTGMLCGMVYCIPAFLNGNVEFQPDFSGETLEVDLHFEGILIPAAVIMVILKVLAVFTKERLLSKLYWGHSLS